MDFDLEKVYLSAPPHQLCGIRRSEPENRDETLAQGLNGRLYRECDRYNKKKHDESILARRQGVDMQEYKIPEKE
jgi:hypothetical protein